MVHMATATTELLEKYKINFIELPSKGADLSLIERALFW
jgi:hypothetical protein